MTIAGTLRKGFKGESIAQGVGVAAGYGLGEWAVGTVGNLASGVTGGFDPRITKMVLRAFEIGLAGAISGGGPIMSGLRLGVFANGAVEFAREVLTYFGINWPIVTFGGGA